MKSFVSSGRIAVTCSKDNTAAGELYEKKGFLATSVEDEAEIELVLS